MKPRSACRKALGLEQGRMNNPMLRAEVATWEIDGACFGLTAERVTDEVNPVRV